MADLDELAARFRNFGRTAAARAPLYGRLSDGIAGSPRLVALLRAAPEQQQLPVLLFAAVHHLVLAGGDELELRRWYPNLANDTNADDPFPAFSRFCDAHRAE